MSDENFVLLDTLREVASELNCTLAQLALAWCLKRQGVSSVIVGATKPEQVTENAKAADLEIPDGLWETLEKFVPPATAK